MIRSILGDGQASVSTDTNILDITVLQYPDAGQPDFVVSIFAERSPSTAITLPQLHQLRLKLFVTRSRLENFPPPSPRVQALISGGEH